jgi:hypothetical protein
MFLALLKSSQKLVPYLAACHENPRLGRKKNSIFRFKTLKRNFYWDPSKMRGLTFKNHEE